MNEETKNLLNIAKRLAGKQLITYEELQGFVTDVANILAQYRSATSQINKETKDTLNTLVKSIDEAHSQIITNQENKIEKVVSREMEQISKLVKDCKTMCDEVMSIKMEKPKKGDKGERGDAGEKGDKGNDGKDGSPDTPEQVRNKLESLKEEERLDASAIKGLEKFIKTTKQIVNGGVRLLTGLVDVSISTPSNGQALVYDSTLGLWKNGTVSGAGDVVGPASATDNAIARYDGTTGKLIQNSSASIADDGTLSATSVSAGGSAFTNININGSNGNGHIHLKHQASDPSSQASASTIFADSTGNLAWINNGLSKVVLDLDGATAARTYTYQDASGTLAFLTDVIARSISSISTNTSAGSTTKTDYIYICTASLTLTLPTAVGNTNIYTVKNSSGTTTIATTSSQTIDGASTYQLITPQSVTLVSNGSNWVVI